MPATREKRTPTATGGAAADVAREYLEAFGRGDVDAAAELLHPEVVEDVLPVGVLRGREEVRGFLREAVEAMPDREFRVVRVVADGDVAACEWRLAGTFSGAPYQGIEPTGAHVEMRGVDLIEVREGAIVRNTAYFDGTEFARAVGMLPAAGSGAERAMKAAFNGVTRARSVIRERLSGA